jgi:hypothetical protein
VVRESGRDVVGDDARGARREVHRVDESASAAAGAADDDPLADLDTSSPAPVAASATKTTTVAEASDEDWDAFSDALVINAERASEVDRVAAVLTLLRKRKLSSAQLSDTLKAMEEDRFDWQSAQITNATAVA